MSEHYIKSQYLFKKIATDFFDEQPDSIRIKDIPYEIKDVNIDSDDESSVEENLENDEYFFLESDTNLHEIFDVCIGEKDILKSYTIYICGYKIDNSSVLPFSKFFMIQEDSEYVFPNFKFKCPRNIVTEEEENSPQHIHFHNTCTKFLLKYFTPLDVDEMDFENSYKGFYKSETLENTIYVIFDITKFQLKETGEYAIIDEIMNTHKILDKPIISPCYNVFYELPELIQIKDKNGKSIEIPSSLYKCYIENGKYENEKKLEEGYMSLIELKSVHPLLDDNFIFSCTAFKESSNLKRYAVFLNEPIYLVKNISFIEKKEEKFTLSSIIPSFVEKTPKEMVETIKDMTKSEEQKDESDQEQSDQEQSDQEQSDQEQSYQEQSDQDESDQEQSDQDESDQDESIKEQSQKYIENLKNKFEEVKAQGRKMIQGIKSNPPTETPDSGLIYWKELKENTKDEDYKNDKLFTYKWVDKWKSPPFDVEDRRNEFSWPNGYPNEPKGTATSAHYKNQLYRIPTTKEPNSISILQIALNIGQAEENYEFDDFVEIIYEENVSEEESVAEEENEYQHLIELSKNDNSIYYHENIEDQENTFWLVKSNTHFVEL